MIKFKKYLKIFKLAIINTVMHDGIEHAGYLAFLLMLSIFPFIFILMTLVSLLGSQYLGDMLINIVLESNWSRFIDALIPRIREITSTPPQSLITIALISAIITASSIMEAMRTIINRAYAVENPPAYLFRRMISIIEFAVLILATIIMLLIFVFTPIIIQKLGYYLNLNEFISEFMSVELSIIRKAIIIMYSLFLVSGFYLFLPNTKNKLFDTIPGSIIVLIGWTLFSILFRYYIEFFPQINLIYGSIAGIIIALLYFYFCSIIFIFGAEFNALIKNNYEKL